MSIFLEIVLGIITANVILVGCGIILVQSTKVQNWYIKTIVKITDNMMKSMD